MKSEDFKTLIQAKREKEANRDSKYKRDSKKKLEETLKKRMTTTMIGALDAVEKELGFLWLPDEKGVLSDEAVFLERVYQSVRSKILDVGNHQIKLMQDELKQYEIEWLRYQITLLPKEKLGEMHEKQNRSDG